MEEPWIGARGREAILLDAGDLDGDGVAEIVVPHYLADIVLSAEQTRGDRRGFVWLLSEPAVRPAMGRI